MQREDLTGRTFGNWLAIEYAGDRKWICECQCELHTRKAVSTSTLKSGRSTSCGLCNKIQYDLTGRQFGELKVIRYTGKDNKWLCKCSCGALVEKTSKHLRSGVTSTCGNMHKANLAKAQDNTNINNVQQIKQIRPKYKPAGDWTVLGRAVDDGYYTCRCICGYERVMSDSSIYNARKNNYTCNHANIIGKMFGSLEVIDRKTQKECLCKCHACGRMTTVLLGNLLNGTATTCGCSKAPTYTKEQLVDIINKYIEEHNGDKPQPLILKDLIGLGETATYENIKRYNLESYLDRYSSIGEKQVADIFKNTDMVKHDRKVLNGLELDMYIPSKKLAIEYNGSFWHSSNRKEKTYHQNKTIACARKGIHLIHIFDYEWADPIKRKKITEYLKGFIAKRKLYHARDLDIQIISSSVAVDFYNEYHLQGGVKSECDIALMDKNEIISVMSFRAPRFDHSYEWEITRYCNKNGIIVTGGAERLFTYFIRKYDPTSVLTYVDITKFTGNVYTRLGFKTTEDFLTTPNYVWVNKEYDVLPRYKTQKKKLIANNLGTIDQTEDEIMENIGYVKVYDSGNLKLEWIKQ